VKALTLIFAALATAILVAGCGGEIEVPTDQAQAHRGAELFNQRCSGCHSLDAANAYGSKPPKQKKSGERTNGPNFNVRKEDRSDVLFAIRNGGFSGAIMPANIVVGEDAHAIADFLSKYSGGRHPDDDLTDTGTTPGG
jgi:mono/diheme cytochrome c family protein